MKPIIQPPQRMRFRNFAFGAGSFLLIVFSLGVSSAPKNAPAVSLDAQMNNQVRQALDSLKAAYESENLSDLINLLDSNFENSLTFQSKLEDYFLSYKNPELMFITDTLLINKNKVSVRLHWLKKAIDNSGTFSKSQGSSQFVFKKYSDKLRLLYIRGDNPFF